MPVPHTFGCNCEDCWNLHFDARQASRIVRLNREIARRQSFGVSPHPDHVTLTGRAQFLTLDGRTLAAHFAELRGLLRSQGIFYGDPRYPLTLSQKA